MTTISFNENIESTKRHFKTLEDFQLFVVQKLQKSEVSDAHKSILDERLKDLQQYPQNSISIEELKASIKRK